MSKGNIEAYLAFSIHGTNTFVTATRSFPSHTAFDTFLKKNPKTIKLVQSRNPNALPNTRKLEFVGFFNKDGKPTRSRTKVLQVLHEFASTFGFKVGEEDRKKFVAYHWQR